MGNGLNGLAAALKARKQEQPETKPTVAVTVTEAPKAPEASKPPVAANPLAAKLGLGAALKRTAVVESVQAQVVQQIDAVMDFDSLMNSEDMGEVPDLEDESNALRTHAFDDETPADKPVREPPADSSAQMKLFIELMDNMYDTELRQDLEMMSGMIRSIMVELKSNPQYIQQVRKEDVRTWVQAMRQTMGLAKIKKAEKQEKRKAGGTGSRGGGKSKKTDDVFDDVFAELGMTAT